MCIPVRSLVRGAHLLGRGGPPAGLPCGSQVPTYSSMGIRPLFARGGTSITMCLPAVRVQGHAGGEGGWCQARRQSGSISVGGGVGAAKGLHPCFLVPKGNQPTACTLALWWLKFGPTGGRGGGAPCPRLPCSTARARRSSGGRKGHDLLMQLSSLGSSKMEISKTDFFDTLTI